MTTLLAFAFVLGVLVFVHEMGHYLAARWRGVHVDAFSIGFGRPLWRRTDRRDTEWRLGWLPLGGYGSFQHLVLPAVTLGILGGGWYARMTRSSMVEVLRQDYITTARAKGLEERFVLLRHIVRNALLPVVTILGYRLSFLLSGTVVIETIFAWPGIGRLLVNAIFRRDYQIVQTIVFLSASLIVMINLVTDLVYAYVDPRIRYR